MLTIILVDYHNETKTVEFVKSQLNRLTTPHHLVIVSNAATKEGTAKLQKELGGTVCRKVTTKNPAAGEAKALALSIKASRQKDGNRDEDPYIIPTTENLGYARGNNLGAVFEQTLWGDEYLLFTNNDVQIKQPDTADVLIRTLESHPEAACTGPRIVGRDGREQSPEPYRSFFDNFIWNAWAYYLWPVEKRRRYFKWDYATEAREGLHYNVTGSFFMVRTSDFLKAGMMDPHTFLYAEEQILSERFRSIGRGEYYQPCRTVVHEHSVTVFKYMSAKRKNKILFKSHCYYHRRYRHVGRGEMFLGLLTFRFVELCNWKKELVRRLKERKKKGGRP